MNIGTSESIVSGTGDNSLQTVYTMGIMDKHDLALPHSGFI